MSVYHLFAYNDTEHDNWDDEMNEREDERMSEQAGGKVFIVEVERVVNRNVYVRAWNERDIDDIPDEEWRRLWENGTDNDEWLDKTQTIFVGWESSADPDYFVDIDITDLRYSKAATLADDPGCDTEEIDFGPE